MREEGEGGGLLREEEEGGKMFREENRKEGS